MKKNKKNILILGSKGMLGHLVLDYFNRLKKYNVEGTSKKELNALMDEKKIERILKKYDPDYIVNCIGIINKYSDENPSLTKTVNTVFPHLLAYLSIKNGWKLIHISTDCYLDNDLYGKTKFLGEINDRNNLTIRTSIIGPEIKKKGAGLFDWFMFQKEEVKGFSGVFWDGVTTLQLAKFIEYCINKHSLHGIVDYRTKNNTDKYKLLFLISKIFNKKIKIIKDERKMKDKRNLNPDFWCKKNYEIQLKELKKFIGKKEKYTK